MSFVSGAIGKLGRRWACLALALALVVDLIIADPLPFVDEAVLAALVAACFARHSRRDAAEEAGASGTTEEADAS